MNTKPSYHPFQSTVLVSSSTNPTLSSDHPLFYAKQKNYFLEQLSNKAKVQSRFNPDDLKRNVRINHLISQHDNITRDIKKEKKRRQMFLKSDQFQPILGISAEEKRRIKQQRSTQQLRDQLYNNYVLQVNIHEEPVRDFINTSSTNQRQYQQFPLGRSQQQLKNYTMISDFRSDPNLKKQLYLLDLQISKLKQQQRLQKQVKIKLQSCTNNELLSKMSNSIMSSYLVHFDDIFNLMIDEILQQEVVYLNGLQADYYVGDREQKNKSNNKQQDIKTIKLMEVLGALDDLAYD